MIGTSVKGRLLVATPALSDGIFDRTVVLVLEHDDEGALGIVLNRPSTTDVGDVLPAWADVTAPPRVVFAGGPVSPEAAVCLARVRDVTVDGWSPLVADVGSLDLTVDAALVGPSVSQLRVYSGYAGWSSSQLDSEVEVGGWFVVDTERDDIFCADPDALWQRVLRRQRGHLALYAAYPPDPTAN